MKKYQISLVWRMVAIFTVICTMLSSISVCSAEEVIQQEYTLRIKQGEINTYLDVTKRENVWFVEAHSIAKLANCQLQEKNGRVTLSRGDQSTILYEAGPDAYFIAGEDIYLPFKEATTAVGVCFYVNSNMLTMKLLKVPKELTQIMATVFVNDQLILSRMQNDLGWLWSTAQNAARAYSIMPFVGSYSFVGAITGENEIQQYEEAFGHVLSNEGILYDMLQEFSDFDQTINDHATIFGLAEQLTRQDGALEPYIDKYGIDEELISMLSNEYPEAGYGAGIEEWLSAYTDATTALNIKYVLDACTLYSATMDAEESMIAAMKSAFEFCGNYSAKAASERIVTRRCGSDLSNLTNFYKGWALDTLLDSIGKKLEGLIIGDSMPTELAIAAITRFIDFRLEASDKSNAILFYDIYTSIQNELRRYYNQLGVDQDLANIYEQRAATIMYLKCGISAYENMKFDDSIKNAVTNAQKLFAEYLVDILAFSQQEYAPAYDNQDAVDWLNTNEEMGELSRPQYLIDYLGMSVNEITQIFGEDYDIIDGLMDGGSKGIYYKDGRASANFYFHDPYMEGVKTGNEKINIIETGASGWLIDKGISTRSTYLDLKNRGLDGEIFVGDPGISDWGYTYTCEIDSFTYVIFDWNFGDDPATTYPALITLYKKGLEVDALEATPEEDHADVIEGSISMDTYGGTWNSAYIDENLPTLELTITSIENNTITCDLYSSDMYGWGDMTGKFISNNIAEISTSMGEQYMTFRLMFDGDCITLNVDNAKSYFLEAGEQYVFRTRSDK